MPANKQLNDLPVANQTAPTKAPTAAQEKRAGQRKSVLGENGNITSQANPRTKSGAKFELLSGTVRSNP